MDGIRDSKTVNGVRHDYVTLDGKIVRESYGGNTVDYFYDNEGRLYKLVVKEAGKDYVYTGYYVLNLQGDVIGIVDYTGAAAVRYTYDAWGKTVSTGFSGTHGEKLHEYNALKYRGYYYDADLGMYYLNSRFYDAEISRFINADGYVSTGTGFLGIAMFSYCLNNPVNMVDRKGGVPDDILLDNAKKYENGGNFIMCGGENNIPQKVSGVGTNISTSENVVSVGVNVGLDITKEAYITGEKPTNIGQGTHQKNVVAKLDEVNEIQRVTNNIFDKLDYVDIMWEVGGTIYSVSDQIIKEKILNFLSYYLGIKAFYISVNFCKEKKRFT